LQTVGRGTWALQSLDDWAPWLERMVAANPSGGPLPVSDTDDLLQQLASTMGPVFAGMQFGSAIGHLAQRALGHFELPIPRPGTTISLVPENIARFAEDWSLAIDQARLWVCVRELTAYTVLSRPTVVERIGTLLDRATSEAADTSRDLASRLSDLGPDPQDLERILADPEALLADLLAPDRQFGSEQLVVATTAIGAYVDYITTQVAGRLLGSTATLSEAWFRYRTADTANARGAAVLFGLDLSKERVEQGASFVRGVVERAGDDGLARLWETAASLPTPAELLAPGLWLERIDLARAE
jgi:putative hydrolase